MDVPTQILPFEHWPLIQPVMSSVFKNSMPVKPEQSTFLTALDGEKLAGFVHVEDLLHVNCVYVAPEYRSTRLSWDLMRETARLIPHGFSALVLAEPTTHTKLLERMGMRLLGNFNVWRGDR